MWMPVLRRTVGTLTACAAADFGLILWGQSPLARAELLSPTGAYMQRPEVTHASKAAPLDSLEANRPLARAELLSPAGAYMQGPES